MFELNKKEPGRTGAESQLGLDNGSQGTGSAGHASSTRLASGGMAAVIGRSIQIVGDLRGEEDLRIEGDIKGSVHLPNHSLTIGSEGCIHADVYAKSVIVDGEISGDIYGSECATIRAKARVKGNILAPRVSLEEGARFKGSIDMDPQHIKAAIDKVQSLVPNRQSERPTAGRANGSGAPSAVPVDAASTKSSSVKSVKTESAL